MTTANPTTPTTIAPAGAPQADESRLVETRSYPAPAAAAARANVGPEEHARAAADPLAFW